MPNSEYIKQLTSPSFKVFSNNPTPPRLFDEYFSTLESMRVEFIEYLRTCNENIVRAYLQEVEEAIKTIEGRHFIQIGERDLSAMLLGGLEKESTAFRECKMMDIGLMKSAKKTLSFINATLNTKSDPIPMSVPQPQQEEAIDEKKVISSTQGLADFLGCGKTKAFEIIKSGILKEAGIQYKVGRTWKFNAAKLSKYITEHPDFLQ